MPPRRSARSKAVPAPGAAPAQEALVYPPAIGEVPRLAALAPELFYEILSYLKVLPLTLNYGALPPGGIPYLHPFAERNETLRALSQTCRALRKCAHPLLWERLDCLLVPEPKGGAWYKYVMAKIRRFSKGLAESPGLRIYVRSISISITASQTEETLSYLASLLPVLPALRTIQVLGCNQPGKLSAAVKGLSLDSVRTVAVGSDAHAFVRCCAHATHVRCAGTTNAAMLSALAGCKSLERFDGMFDWSEPKNTLKLVKSAPNLKHLELRQICTELNWHRAPDAISKWRTTCLPQISKLPHLSNLSLTFPTPDSRYPDAAHEAAAQETYAQVVEDARKLIAKKSASNGCSRLVIRYVEHPSYDNSHLEDFVREFTKEIFD